MARRRAKPPTPPEDPADIPLNDDEQRFIDEYLVDRNATRSYHTTFPNVSHYTARTEGCRMLARPNVRREVNAAIQSQSIRTQVTADKILKELARIATSDIWDLYDPQTGLLRHPRHIPYETRKAIASIRVQRERRTIRRNNRSRTTLHESIVEYKLWPKMEALGKLCRHLGLDTEITPLEALLRALPGELSAAVRQALSADQNRTAPSLNGHVAPTKETK